MLRSRITSIHEGINWARSRDLAALCSAAIALAILGASAPSHAQVPDRFSWADVQSHPLAAPGQVYEGLPDGNYLTPNEKQGARCQSGCVLLRFNESSQHCLE